MNTDGMSEDISRLFKMMKIELDKQTTKITENVTDTIMRSIDEKIKPILEENKKLKTEMETLNKKVKNLEEMNRKNNLILHGIKETENNYQDLFNKIKDIMHNIGISIDTYEINKYYRLGRKYDNTRTRPILISLSSYNKKIEILRKKMNMPQHTYITEDFSKETLEIRKNLQGQLKQEKAKGNEAFIRNNKLVINEKSGVDKRKREYSASPKNTRTSTQLSIGKNIIAPSKMHKTDAFAYMKARSFSGTEQHTQQHKL